jgi:hypothetical protein
LIIEPLNRLLALASRSGHLRCRSKQNPQAASSSRQAGARLARHGLARPSVGLAAGSTGPRGENEKVRSFILRARSVTFRFFSGAASPASSFPRNDERANLFRATEPPERHRARNQLLAHFSYITQ